MVRIYADHHFNITTIIINSSNNPSFNFNLICIRACFHSCVLIIYSMYGMVAGP